MLFGIKCGLHLHVPVTELLVTFPVRLLTFVRAVVYLTTSGATEHLAAFRNLIPTAAWVETPAHLFHGLDFFVLLVEATTRNALPVICNKCVFIRAYT